MKNLISIICILFLIGSCDKEPGLDCSNALPPPNYFHMDIVDSSGNSFIGSLSIQDSIRLYNNSFEKYISPENFDPSYAFKIFYPDIESEIEYFIELDNMDIDTVTFNYSITPQECFDSYVMNTIEFNGQNMTISNSEGKYDLIKQ